MDYENHQNLNHYEGIPKEQSDHQIEEKMPEVDIVFYEEEVTKSSEKPKEWKKWLICIGMAVLFGVIASAVYLTSNYLVQKYTGYGKTVDKTVTTITADENEKEQGAGNNQLTDVAQVAENVMPSVVSITNLSVQEVQSFFFGGITEKEYESSGSGIIVGQSDTELLIVSNNHVVEGSKVLTVSFVDGTSVEAKIRGTDASIDLAVIAVPIANVSEETMGKIKIATLGNSDELAVGEPAIAIGNALGYGQSVTYGIVSALGRELSGINTGLIQTDAAINPGNSGGALLNRKGEVIGINTAKVSGNNVEGMGYAIPISDVNDIINDLMNREVREKVEASKRGSLGISAMDVDAQTAQNYGIPQGVFIKEIIEGGAAQKAGMIEGSVIVKFDGTSISSKEKLQEELEYYKAGEKVEVVAKVPSQKGGYVEKTYKITLSGQSVLND